MHFYRREDSIRHSAAILCIQEQRYHSMSITLLCIASPHSFGSFVAVPHILLVCLSRDQTVLHAGHANMHVPVSVPLFYVLHAGNRVYDHDC